MRYINPCFWGSDIAPMKSLQLTVDEPTKQISFEQACLEYAAELHQKSKINIFWSGGVDSSHIVALFLLQGLDITITATHKSTEEYPLMAKMLQAHKLVTYIQVTKTAKNELSDFILDDYLNVYGDPELHVLSSFKWYIQKPFEHKHSMDFCAFDKNLTTEDLNELSEAPLVTKSHLLAYLDEYHNVADNYVLLAPADKIKLIVPFYAEANILESAKKDKRFWQHDCRPYKYVQKQLIYKLMKDKEYYLYKDKRGSAGNYKHDETIYLLLDDYTAITNKQNALKLLMEYTPWLKQAS